MKTNRAILIVVSIVLAVCMTGCGVLQAEPTYTPQPTYTLQSTYTVQPTDTPTATPIPTMAIPTNSTLPKPPSGTPVIDVTFDVQNLPKNGVDYSNGKDIYIWALGTYTARFQVWFTGGDKYVIYVYDNGTFVSFAGKSPAGTGIIGDGVTGTFFQEFAYSLTGSLLPSPAKPSSGYIGSYDAKGDQQGHAEYQPGIDTYFQQGSKVGNFLGSSEKFTSCGNGKFSWNMNGVTGDITGSPAPCSASTQTAVAVFDVTSTAIAVSQFTATPLPPVPPTEIPETATALSEMTINRVNPIQILEDNGFTYAGNGVAEGCPESCIVFKNPSLGLTATVEEHQMVEFKVQFGNGVDPSAQATALISLINSIFNPKVVAWINNANAGALGGTDQRGTVDNFEIFMRFSKQYGYLTIIISQYD